MRKISDLLIYRDNDDAKNHHRGNIVKCEHYRLFVVYDNKVNESQIPFWQVEYGDDAIAAVVECMKNRQYSMGQECKLLEKELADLLRAESVLGVTSGSDALLMSLIALGVGPGKRILLQDRSWIAAANAIGILGGEIILVDVLPNSGTIDLEDLEKKYQDDVVGLVIVEMNGHAPDMLRLKQFCTEKGIFLVEDAAQAIGSMHNNRHLGNFGDVGCFSLSTAKLVGSGQGGFVVTNSADIATTLEKVRLHGNTQIFTPVWERLGFNFRLTDVHAAIARTQLRKLAQRAAHQRTIFQLYSDGLANLSIGRIVPIHFNLGQLGPYVEFIVRSGASRTDLISYFFEQGIELRPFYPSLINAQRYLKIKGHTPNALKVCESGLYLPSGPGLKLEQVERIVNAMKYYDVMVGRH